MKTSLEVTFSRLDSEEEAKLARRLAEIGTTLTKRGSVYTLEVPDQILALAHTKLFLVPAGGKILK